MIVDGEWDGVCACGKVEMDGKRCALGATHTRLERTHEKGPDAAEVGTAVDARTEQRRPEEDYDPDPFSSADEWVQANLPLNSP